jgi:hypothetical protein
MEFHFGAAANLTFFSLLTHIFIPGSIFSTFEDFLNPVKDHFPVLLGVVGFFLGGIVVLDDGQHDYAGKKIHASEYDPIISDPMDFIRKMIAE